MDLRKRREQASANLFKSFRTILQQSPPVQKYHTREAHELNRGLLYSAVECKQAPSRVRVKQQVFHLHCSHIFTSIMHTKTQKCLQVTSTYFSNSMFHLWHEAFLIKFFFQHHQQASLSKFVLVHETNLGLQLDSLDQLVQDLVMHRPLKRITYLDARSQRLLVYSVKLGQWHLYLVD